MKTERKNRKVRINRIQTNRYSDKKSKSSKSRKTNHVEKLTTTPRLSNRKRTLTSKESGNVGKLDPDLVQVVADEGGHDERCQTVCSWPG